MGLPAQEKVCQPMSGGSIKLETLIYARQTYNAFFGTGCRIDGSLYPGAIGRTRNLRLTMRFGTQRMGVTSLSTGRSSSRFVLAFHVCQRELASRYAGSILGVIWAVVFPGLQITLYAVVLHFGFQLQTGGGASLLTSLIAGMLP